MSDPGATERLAELATLANPSSHDRARARVLLLDYLAVTTAGAGAESSTTAFKAIPASGMANENGVGHNAALFGFGGYASPRDAAIVNGIAAHSSELDDTHEPSSSHPGTVIWTALLAAGAGRPHEGRLFLDSAIVGYQVMASLGELLGPARLYDRGLHPTAICGVFGASAAVARLRGLDTIALRHAFGIALSMCAGSMAYLSDGAWTKRLHSGIAASNGLLAVDLSAAGFTGPLQAFEDPNGLLHLCGLSQESLPTEAVLGHARSLRAVHETSIKFHPCCRYMHGVMDLLASHRSAGGRFEGIESIDCGVLSAGIALVAEPLLRKRKVLNTVDAQFSMPFGAALSFANGTSSIQDFTEADRVATELQTLIDKVVVHTSAELDAPYPAQWGAEVRLRFDDGEQVNLSTRAFRGSPGWPAGREEVYAKATSLLGTERSERLAASVECLSDEQLLDTNQLIIPRAGW